MIRQASAELARGLTFRAVLRTLVAERTGQLAFDFQPAKTTATRQGGGAPAARARALTALPPRAWALGLAVMPSGAPISEDRSRSPRAISRKAPGSIAATTISSRPRFSPTAARWRSTPDGRGDRQSRQPPLRARRDPEAEALYEKALLMEPTCFEARFNLGNVYHDTGRFEEALKCYVQALAVDQGYADAHFYLAVTLEKLGRSGEARPHWIAYQRLAPNGEWVELAREFSDKGW